jgi:triacylglycerol lipase
VSGSVIPSTLSPEAPFLANAQRLAQVAMAAYWELSFQPQQARLAFPEIQTFADPETHTFALAAQDERNVVLAFRGSQNLPNFMSSVNVRLVPGFGGNVHQGFMHAWAMMRGPITALLDRWHTPGHTLWLTGHSLGGALATLAAADFKGQGRPVQQVMTFGAPRVGDAAFAQGYQLPTIRFVNHHDPVPWVPPHLEHVGQQWYFLPSGQLVEKVSRWQLVLENALTFALNRNWANTLAAQLRRSFRDHTMTTYLAKLAKAATLG